MAKFYADESVPRLFVQQLREDGHAVTYNAENPQRTTRKNAVTVRALRTMLDRSTLVLTLDQDAQRWIVEKNMPVLGVVSIQTTNMSQAEQVKRATQVIQEQGHCLKNFLTTIYSDCVEMCPFPNILRESPFSDQPRIIITPNITPTIKGTQITVAFIVEQIFSGLTSTELRTAYPQLTGKSINAALLYHRNQLIHENGYPCPCCGYLVFDKPSGSYDICPICAWEDEAMDIDYLLSGGGANKVSLLQGQQNYLAFGASEERFQPYVRPPLLNEKRAEGWRPLDPATDIIDTGLPKKRSYQTYIEQKRYMEQSFLKDPSSIYYWSPTCWQRGMRSSQGSSQQQASPSNEETP